MHWIALRSQPVGHDPAAPEPEPELADAGLALSWWALQFTPLVARVDDAVLLETSASERLFGGRQALLQRLLAAGQQRFALVWAEGPTALVALGRLWSGMPQAAADALPLEVLQAARAHLPTLLRLGCQTWGQLRALPRGGLARRFGAPLLEALDRAYGARPEVYPWVTLAPVFEASPELPAAVEVAAMLLFGARRLLGQLQVWLQARQLGLLGLELGWQLDARRSNALHVDAHHDGSSSGRLEVRTAQASADMAHVQRLLGEQLARVQLPAPVWQLRLRSLQTQPLAGETRSLLPKEQRAGDSRHQMLERLGARLGVGNVLCVQPAADHLPERMQQWLPWAASGAMPAQASVSADPPRPWTGAQGALYPTWLLAAPLPLALQGGWPQYQGALALLLGPQRLETGGLHGAAALRDYFVARSPQAGLLWIYRERLARCQARWYLHGLFA